MNPAAESGIQHNQKPSMLKTGMPDLVWDQAQHERWLAMKAAYNRYINASAPLDDFVEELGNVQVRLLHNQRMAYEEYVEARLQFSESLLPQFSAGAVSRQSNEVASQSWTRSVTSKLAIVAVAITFLCITALGPASRIYEPSQVSATDEATASQTRDDCLIPKSNASNSEQQVPTQSGSSAKLAPIRPAVPPAVQATVSTRVAWQRWRRVQVSAPKTNKRIGYAQPAKLQRSGKRGKYEFTLKLVPHYERIGPIQVSLRRVDWKKNDFELSLLYGNFTMEEKHIRLYEPLWIRLSGRAQAIQLMADRIGQNYVHGYLCESGCNKQELMPGLMQRADPGFKLQPFFRF